MRARKSAQADNTPVTPVAKRARRTQRGAETSAPARDAEAPAQLSLLLPAGVSRSMASHPVPAPAASATGPDYARVARPSAGVRAATPAVRQHLGELREALAEGWEIVQPIFARPLWSSPDDSATAFNFVLRGPHGTRLITVPQGRGVDRFIRDRRLRVDYVR
ncbi:MAG TPA: hypothetical protein VF818_09920 [Ktedonobacterales bacterium]